MRDRHCHAHATPYRASLRLPASDGGYDEARVRAKEESVSLHRITILDLTAGAEVFTADSERLGSVKDVTENDFMVDVPLQRDYWLGREFVVGSTPERVTVSFEKRDVGAYKLAQPGGVRGGSSGGTLSDSIIPEEEQVEQRASMAMELAEQRQRLAHAHPEGGEDAPPDTGGTLGVPVEEELGLAASASSKGEARSAAATAAMYVVPAVAAVGATIALFVFLRRRRRSRRARIADQARALPEIGNRVTGAARERLPELRGRVGDAVRETRERLPEAAGRVAEVARERLPDARDRVVEAVRDGRERVSASLSRAAAPFTGSSRD